MLYTDYKLAAEKHIKTCLGMAQAIDKLNSLDNSALLVSSNKQAALHNMFYMCGYVLESISTYAIYKNYNWNANQSIKQTNSGFISRTNFSFFQNHGNLGNQYCVQYHDFQNNQFEILKQLSSSFIGVPMIDSSISIDAETLILFQIWKPEIRYHEANKIYPSFFNSQISFNETNVLKFIDFTNKVYNSLIQIVG